MKGKKEYLAIKLDICKAYDRVEWDYLEAIMHKLGFAGPWINRIMQCVKSVSYSILINGTPYGQITPTRGIRQWDPLSPYLFLLCAEGLSASLGKVEDEGLILGAPIAARGYKLSHLLFPDNNLLFCRVNSVEWDNVLSLLTKYEKVSEQKLNSHKTSIFYSRNTGADFKAFITASAGLQASSNLDKYLGLSALIGRSKKEKKKRKKNLLSC